MSAKSIRSRTKPFVMMRIEIVYTLFTFHIKFNLFVVTLFNGPTRMQTTTVGCSDGRSRVQISSSLAGQLVGFPYPKSNRRHPYSWTTKSNNCSLSSAFAHFHHDLIPLDTAQMAQAEQQISSELHSPRHSARVVQSVVFLFWIRASSMLEIRIRSS